MVTRVPRRRCTRPLKPYQGVRARTTTQSFMLSESVGFRAPGSIFRDCSARYAASAAASFSRRKSSMLSPTILSFSAPASDSFSFFRTPVSFRMCSSERAWNSAANWLRMRSCLAIKSTSSASTSCSFCISCRVCVSSRVLISAASRSRSCARAMDSFRSTSSCSALRCSAKSDRWSSLRSASARSTRCCGSCSRLAVSMACDSPTSLRVSRKVGLPSLYSIAAISVRSSSSAQFLSCMQCVVATRRAPHSRNASMTARASAAPCEGSVPVPASSTMTNARWLVFWVLLSMILEATRWAEYVDRSSTMVCMSPISANTTSKKSTRGDSPPGTGMPHLARRARRPMVFSTTVLPPAFGPLRIRPCVGLPSSSL
mmetsp:Transcript_5602/g.14232  ORF Transcript_5602/g.14232 Transcript_5602/m.14232 type:complete len:372 (+) Transcript_5602:253-1368(+)